MNAYSRIGRFNGITHMVDNGAPLEVIQSLLGYEKSETTGFMLI